jgi:hypothetical protein
MEFEYEITADDYAAANVLYHRLISARQRGSEWFLAGAIFLIIALVERERGLSPVLLGAIGIWWMGAGLGRVFPRLLRGYYRRYYKRVGLAGQKYYAKLNEEGFQVAGNYCTWQNRWADVSPEGEDNCVFMLFSHGFLFIFAKRYLTDEQQQALRTLAGLSGA